MCCVVEAPLAAVARRMVGPAIGYGDAAVVGIQQVEADVGIDAGKGFEVPLEFVENRGQP